MPKLNEEKLIAWASQEFRDARGHSADWRKLARTAYDYKAGEQWTTADKAKMRAEDRPIITFNRLGVFVRAVVGLEVSNRQEMVYKPEEVNDTAAVGVANQTAGWVRRKCDAEYEQSAAFEDLVTCGMGWTETLIEYDTDLDGKICETQEDPLKCYWDPAARKPNLADARWVGRVKEFSRDEFDRKFPKFKDLGESSILGEDEFWDDSSGKIHDATRPAYQSDQNYAGAEQRTAKVRVFEFQYYEQTEVIRYDLADGRGLQQKSPAGFRKLEDRSKLLGQPLPRGVKQLQRHYYRAIFSGRKVLEHEELEDVGDDKIPDFTLQCMTGYFDHNNGIWYGLIKDLIDPQNWSNKYFSQAHDLFNSSIKGGVWYEKSAIDNITEFERKVSMPNAAIQFEDGALQNKRVIQPQAPSMPSGAFQLHEFAVNALPNLSGLNPELMGLAGRDQPGILESQRKQASLTILATLFDALRQYRLRQGRILLWFIRNYMHDERIARIIGEQNVEYIKAFRAVDASKFDIRVGDAPSSPHMKERVFTMFMQIMPLLGDKAALILPMLIKYSDFPSEVVDPLLKQLQQSQQETPEQRFVKQLSAEQAVSEIRETDSKTELNLAKALAEAENVDIKEVKNVHDVIHKAAKLTSDARLEEMEIKAKANGGSK